jgi:hypothetical protein
MKLLIELLSDHDIIIKLLDQRYLKEIQNMALSAEKEDCLVGITCLVKMAEHK